MKQRFIKYICLSILGEMAISFYPELQAETGNKKIN